MWEMHFDLQALTHLDAPHPLLALEFLAVLQPMDGGHGVAACGTAELDGVRRWHCQKPLLHAIRPGPVR